MAIAQVIIRTVLSFLLLLTLVRLVGKQELSQMTFFDFISGITIGSLAAIAASDLNMAWEPWLATVVWTVLTILAARLALYSRKMRKVIDGEPTILVSKGQVMENNLGRVRLSVDDLRSMLRSKGAFSLFDVEYAILETNGEISVLKSPGKESPTRDELSISGVYTGVEKELIVDGEIIAKNLASLQKDENWLQSQLRGHGVENLSEVFYCSVDEAGHLYVDLYKDKKVEDDISDYKIDQYINIDRHRT